MITLKSTVFSVKVMNLSKIQTKFGCFVNNEALYTENFYSQKMVKY